jgi:membrane-bound lytic murein transglycosylase A
MKFHYLPVLLVTLLVACSQQPVKPTAQPIPNCSCPAAAEAPPIPIPEAPKSPVTPPAEAPLPDYSLLQPASWSELEGLSQDNLSKAWDAWLQSCTALRNKQPWQAACSAAEGITPSNENIQAYFQQYFNVYRTTNLDGSDTGLITGYYEPLLKGSRNKTDKYQYPLYAKPDDLVTVELASLYPELANKRVRGRLTGNRVIPYYTRGEIDLAPSPLEGKELLWVDDAIDAFFLQIQGSGLVQLDTGEKVHVGYADQNGQAYQSIGRLLIERGELTADKASMQGIKNWARNNLDKLRDLLNSNPSYVFFRELPAGLPGPLGALGVPILAERALAVDPHYIPLGAPAFLATTYPNSSKPLNRLMMAQDTGGAIKGGVRADLFWGAGNDAGRLAGAMKQKGKIWVLLPKGWSAVDK